MPVDLQCQRRMVAPQLRVCRADSAAISVPHHCKNLSFPIFVIQVAQSANGRGSAFARRFRANSRSLPKAGSVPFPSPFPRPVADLRGSCDERCRKRWPPELSEAVSCGCGCAGRKRQCGIPCSGPDKCSARRLHGCDCPRSPTARWRRKRGCPPHGSFT